MHDGRDLGITGCACVLWEGPCFTVGAWCKVECACVLWERPVHYGRSMFFGQGWSIAGRALCVMEEAWCMLGVVYA